ncbi:MAG: tyrosine--tRNA ligase [Patescibacteria group bacterium]|nr:tyrosine--tRNA ligase [Patescibacteria group bacterium]
MKIKKDKDIIERLTTRAVEKVLPSQQALRKALTSGKRLNVYQGFDPTADTLHIGHSAGMRKLRDFQLLGHNVIMLIANFTARIGDPSDKTAARTKLTKDEVENNLKNYKNQASRILDFDNSDNPVHIKFNADWLEKLTFQDVVDLTSEFTVQQMLKRDMFQNRLKTEKPIYLHEFLYPVMQAYDAVSMNIDVEVGGTDQMFNMMCGRDLVSKKLDKEKFVICVRLLEDPSGKKMGKSEGNMIMLSDSPQDMYGKVMAFTDGMIVPAFELLTDIDMEEIKQMKTDMKTSKVNPMNLKKKLALLITSEHKGKKAAQSAQKYFEQVFQKKGDADLDTVQEKSIGLDTINIIELLKLTGFAASNSEAKRLIRQSAVSIDNQNVKSIETEISIPVKGLILRTGKKIIKIIT